MGLGAGAIAATYCLGHTAGCNKPPAGTIIELDKRDSENKPLGWNGGYIIKDGIVIARNNSGDIVAASRECSHEHKVAVIFDSDQWYCPLHGARYDQNGGGLNSKGSGGVVTYKTKEKGHKVFIYT